MKRANILYAITLALITTVIFGIYILFATQNNFPQIEPMINGTAVRPFIYRILPSLMIKSLSHIFGISIQLSATVIMYVSLLGFSFTLYALAGFLLPAKYIKRIALFAPIGVLPFMVYQRHIYDFSTLFIFTLALYFLARDNFLGYILSFTIATITKETSLFLVIFFFLQFRNGRMRNFTSWVITQILIYFTLRLSMVFLFRNNPGAILEFHMQDHINAYRQHPMLAAVLFFILIFTAIIVILQKQDKTNFLRNSFIAIGGPTFILYLLAGMPFEIRIFLEAYPSAFLSTALTITTLINRFPSQSEDNAAGHRSRSKEKMP